MTPALIRPLARGVGFIAGARGALAGYGLGLLLGMDIFDQGYGSASILGIALVGLGGGLGLHLARRWRAARMTARQGAQP